MISKKSILLMQALFMLLLCLPAGAQQLSATEIIKKTDDKFKGEQSG